jgi:small subunit ribosomal protein S21
MGSNVVVQVRYGDVEGALKLLKKLSQKDGLLRDMKKRAYYEKPGDAKRRKEREARKKRRKATQRLAASQPPEDEKRSPWRYR